MALLIARCSALAPDFARLEEAGVDLLTDYAVAVRYGDETIVPSVNEAESARGIALMLREFVLDQLAQRSYEGDDTV